MAQRDNQTRSLVWEEETASEPRFRRVQQAVPLSGRGLPGMPVGMQELDTDNFSERGRSRKFQDAPKIKWWRPQTNAGRVFLGLAVIVSISAFATSAFAVRSFLERDSRFRIAGTSNIQATGLTEVNRSEMLPVFGEDVGRNIFFVPLNERRRQLEQIPWVERATVMRILPDQIRVAVVERNPVAFVRQGQQIGLVDSNGVLLSMPAAMMAQRHYSFPVVTGIDVRDPLPSRKTRMAVYQRLLGELDANGQHLSDQISEIDLTNPEDARVLMPEQGTDILAHFGEDQFLERYQRYKTHISEWRQQYPKLSEVDLRYDQQVVLEMTHGTESGAAAVKVGDGKMEITDPAPAEVQKIIEKPKAAKVDTPKLVQPRKSTKTHVSATPPAKSKSAKKKVAPKKKHPDANRTALNLNKQKPAARTHPTAAAGQGQ